jgi:hypothetical protein
MMPIISLEETLSMVDNKTLKVVIDQKLLRGSDRDELLQRVATVYDEGIECRVLAPSRAKGPVLEWMDHLTVHRSVDVNSDEVVDGAYRASILKALDQELKRQERNANRAQGMNPDGDHCDAQICLKGHVLHCDGTSFSSGVYCTKCGARCIDECPECQEPIHGMNIFEVGPYFPPQFCHKCGHAYPWMEERLVTFRELLSQDKKLSPEDRNGLLEDFQYVMSDPKADLVPAKKKLIEFKLENAPKVVRELVLDLMAKVIVESVKP